MDSFWTGTVADVRGSWVRPASVRGLFAVPLMVAIVLGITSVGAAPVLAHSVPSAAAGPPGTGLAWGLNNVGQLGDGTTTDSSTPVAVGVPAGTTVTAVAAGEFHSVAVTSTGTVLAWGYNDVGQLGDGSTTSSSTPVAVDVPAGTTVTAVAAGDRHSLAVTSTGTVSAWGANTDGQLGDGTTTSSSTPVAVDVPAGTTVTAVAAGGAHSVAVTSAGTVLAWGNNNFGQLGDGTTTDSSTPVAVDLPAGTTVTAVAAGKFHSVAVTSAGTVLAWGFNDSGQLGDGTTTNRSTPVAVDLPAGTTVTAVAAGGFHSVAVTSAGTVLAWGFNNFGQLGDGTTTDSSTPVAVDLPAGTTVTALAAGELHSLAVVPSTSTTTLQVSPPNPTPDQPVTLTATVTCTASTPTGTVTFLDGTKTLGTEPLPASPTATLTVTRLTPGTHHIHARYNGDNNCPTSTSNPTTVTIPKPTIPVTGTSLPTILTTGIFLTLTGTALTLATHRRRPTHHTIR
ncbi:Ig-like domain repeat protein [Salinispora arenicola]|uniref:RCC1 domain-containing protein n=1 Tax=Salinispora arenicola TaxID=168697 RepID=UPI000371A944|nr:Ig-like domain repeat protein [Salinispora arenicola]